MTSHRSHENLLHAIFLLLRPGTDSDGGFYNLGQLLGLQFADMTHTLSPVFAIHISSLCQSCGCVLRRGAGRPLRHHGHLSIMIFLRLKDFFNDEVNFLKTYVKFCRIRKRVTWWIILFYSDIINIKHMPIKGGRFSFSIEKVIFGAFLIYDKDFILWIWIFLIWKMQRSKGS